jgi:hypothetical protein
MRVYLVLFFQCILIQCMLIQCLSAQEAIAGPGIGKNVVYVEGESLLFLGNVSFNYERILSSVRGESSYFPYHYSLKAGLGCYYVSKLYDINDLTFTSIRGFLYKLQGFVIWEGGMELGAGLSVKDCKDACGEQVSFLHPLLSVGYRYDDGPFFFRVSGSTWGLGLSFGFSF